MLFLAFDTETTGLPYEKYELLHVDQPRVVQLGCVLFDEKGDEKEILDTLIYPDGWEVDYDSELVHGWTTEDCKFMGQPAKEVLNEFNRLSLVSKTLIAHHIEFDMKMMSIEEAFSGVSLTLPSQKYCTMKRTTDLVKIPYKPGKYKFPTLTEASQSILGKTPCEDGLHDALFDARVAKELFLAIGI